MTVTTPQAPGQGGVPPGDLDDPLALAADLPPTASGVRATTPKAVWRRLRGPLAIALLILVTVIGTTFFRQRARTGALDPTSVTPTGSRALAVLLQERGVDIERTRELPGVPAAGTIFLPFARELSPEALRPLLTPPPGTHVVLIAPKANLEVLGVDITVVPHAGTVGRLLEPDCDLGLAEVAGRAAVGGPRYIAGPSPDAVVHRCYTADGNPSLVRVERAGASVTIIGTEVAFTNAALDEDGNAALAIGLLDQGPSVRWVLRPPLGAAPARESKSLAELLPSGVKWAILQLFFAVLVAMVWRGRRLGPVVVESLPVVVRAAEAVEGRGRLYAAAKARGRAGWNLRRGAQARLTTRLGLPGDASNDVLVDAAAMRTQRHRNDIGRLLYGPDPVDDAGLVRLAADLDTLDSEVRRS